MPRSDVGYLRLTRWLPLPSQALRLGGLFGGELPLHRTTEEPPERIARCGNVVPLGRFYDILWHTSTGAFDRAGGRAFRVFKP